ncbi:hypothetical protein [Legionella fallonii]|uniref:Uncharacterized protein n=1 Tax=Legionella fallonii LLAP-10 TaxID=1212491 RepID=A0A098G0R5_9GAMM|nr:hypothetical protein [Legionella fallonii]CEG55551.1 membrane protein of unknown function [Legionella fallonii LLAP-10]
MKHNLLKGQIPLFITYWIFGIIPWIIYGLIGMALSKYYLSIAIIPYIQFLFYLYLIFPFLYFPLIYIAIWNSSTLYTKNRLWPMLAKISVFLGIVFLSIGAVIIIQTLMHSNDIEYQIKRAVNSINKTVPRKIDESTNIEKVSFDNKLLTYHYKLIDKNKSEINTMFFSLVLKAQLIKTVCKNADLKYYLSRGIDLSYHYVDKNDEEVSDILITKYDCK